jgi:hypothetical protein
MADTFLSETNRAEDILLGALGFGEDAVIVTVELTETGCYRGTGRYKDGETFEFESDIEADELERWAVEVLSRPAAPATEPKPRRRSARV